MGKRSPHRLTLAFTLALCAASTSAQSTAPGDGPEELNRDFQSAQAAYEAGRYAESAAKLEGMLPGAASRYQVQELLGVVYAALGQSAKAVEHLDAAVRLNPDSADAHTNLAATLMHTGKTDRAGVELRRALQLAPASFDTNHNLGEFDVQMGKLTDAVPLLERAQQIEPSSYDNGYDLALADFLTGRLTAARQLTESLIASKSTGELHDLLGQIDEKDGQFIAAEREFETAAHLDPSEENLFDWGGELLLHRAYEPATTVFQTAAERYPGSQRLRIGLGMTLNMRGKYDEAIRALLAAADLDPADARTYVFLSKAYDSSPEQAEDVIQRFKRYADLEPGNAQALYYYALSLWTGKRVGDASLDLASIEALLKRSIELNGSLAEAHLQLGNLYADQHEYAKSIPEYVRALQLDANLSDAHFRLGTDYVHAGQKDQAAKEFDIYQKLRAAHLAEIDKERAEVQQFVYAEKPSSTSKP